MMWGVGTCTLNQSVILEFTVIENQRKAHQMLYCNILIFIFKDI